MLEEDQERQRLELLENDHVASDIEVEYDETTPWLQYTKWPKQFVSRPLDIIATATYQAQDCPMQDCALTWCLLNRCFYVLEEFTMVSFRVRPTRGG